MISVISVINNEKIAKEFLLRGLSNQNTRFELILLDNKASFYKSASQAYNRASIKAKGDYLVFIHQDVLLPSKNWLKETESWLSTLPKFGLAGVAGMLKPKFLNELEICVYYYLLRRLGMTSFWFHRFGRGNIFHGPGKLPWKGKFISNTVSVQTLDELLLIVPSNVFDRIKFDENVCDGWNLYGVDYSLAVSRKGLEVYVLPCPVFHLSIGKINRLYFKTLTKLIEKHKIEKVINTTCGPWPTNQKLAQLLLSKSLFHQPQEMKNREHLA